MTGAADGPVLTLRGERVGLGPLREDLLNTLHLRWGNDLAATMMQGPVGFATPASGRRYFDHRTGSPDIDEFLVYELATMRPIGTTNLHHIDRNERRAEIAYNIMEHDCRRKDYGYEAARLTLDYAFTALGLHRVEAQVYAYNTASIGLTRKLGFTQFGRARQSHWASGRYWDTLLFDMLRDEFDSPVLASHFALSDEPDGA